MKQDIIHILTAVDLAQIVLGWVIVLAAIILLVSKGNKQ